MKEFTSKILAPSGGEDRLVKPKGFKCSYLDLLNYAKSRLKKEFGSIAKFSESEVCKELFPTLSNSAVKNYMSIPAEGGKKVKSIVFIKRIFDYWGINIHQKKITTVEIIIHSSELLV